jgi:hypothetical protein
LFPTVYSIELLLLFFLGEWFPSLLLLTITPLGALQLCFW